MKCFDCKKPFSGSGYFCEACLAAARIATAELEAKAREVACPSCVAGIGQHCITGSSVVRCAHATRHALVKKLAKKAAKGHS